MSLQCTSASIITSPSFNSNSYSLNSLKTETYKNVKKKQVKMREQDESQFTISVDLTYTNRDTPTISIVKFSNCLIDKAFFLKEFELSLTIV